MNKRHTLIAAIVLLLSLFSTAFGQGDATVQAVRINNDIVDVQRAYQLGNGIVVEILNIPYIDFVGENPVSRSSAPFYLTGPSILISEVKSITLQRAVEIDLSGNVIFDGYAPPPLPAGAKLLGEKVNGQWVTRGNWSYDSSASPWVKSPEFGDLYVPHYGWVYGNNGWEYVIEAGIDTGYNAYWFYNWAGRSWSYATKHP